MSIPAASVAPAWRSRIVGSGEEAPDQLLAHPSNWRNHGKAQRAALRAVLDTVGYVAQVIVNQRTGHLVDGHLRVEEALSNGQPSIPVVYVDLSEDEEWLVLASRVGSRDRGDAHPPRRGQGQSPGEAGSTWAT